MAEADFYELLEIERTADDKMIKTSFRRLAMQCHPDRNPGCEVSEAKFKAINAAYDVLKDPQKRAAYDRYGHAAFQQGGGGGGFGQSGGGFEGFSDIFESVFGEFMGGGRGQSGGQSALRGADLRYDLEISLDQAYHGVTEQIRIDVAATCDSCDGSGANEGTAAKGCPTCQGHGKVRAQQGFFVVERTCPTCHGRGQVIADPCRACRGEGRVEKSKTLELKVPRGVDEGTRIRMTGEGEAGARGGPSGDLYVFIHVTAHDIFQRDGTTLFAHAPISFTTAALGGTITVPGLDGVNHELRIPAGIQSGKQLRQRGAGMPVLSGRGQGDMVVQIDVEMPTHLTARQRELLEEFRTTETGKECPRSNGFFQRLKDKLGGE
jgi:molecular chaperone DnaJ